MDENQSDLTLPDITEAEHLGTNDVENDHENGDQVNSKFMLYIHINIHKLRKTCNRNSVYYL